MFHSGIISTRITSASSTNTKAEINIANEFDKDYRNNSNNKNSQRLRAQEIPECLRFEKKWIESSPGLKESVWECSRSDFVRKHYVKYIISITMAFPPLMLMLLKVKEILNNNSFLFSLVCLGKHEVSAISWGWTEYDQSRQSWKAIIWKVLVFFDMGSDPNTK